MSTFINLTMILTLLGHAAPMKSSLPRGEFGVHLGSLLAEVDKNARSSGLSSTGEKNASLSDLEWRHFRIPSQSKYEYLIVVLRNKRANEITLIYPGGTTRPSFQEVLEQLRTQFGRPGGVVDRYNESAVEDGQGGQTEFISQGHTQSAYWFDGRTLIELQGRKSKIQGWSTPENRELSLKFRDIPKGGGMRIRAGHGRIIEFGSDEKGDPNHSLDRPAAR
jgi:hypothetical protein